MTYMIIPAFDDEDLDAREAWDFAVDFAVDDGEIEITPMARWASDENAGYAL